MADPGEDRQTRKKRKVWAWSFAMIGVILLNVSVAILSMSRSNASGWTLFAAGVALLGLAVRLVRSSI